MPPTRTTTTTATSSYEFNFRLRNYFVNTWAAQERGREEREWEKEAEKYSKIHKKPRRDAAANPKTLQHGPGIWPSAAAAAAAVAVARATTTRQLQCPGVVPSPAQAGQLALFSLGFGFGSRGVQRTNIKSYECLVSFVPKCGLQVFPTSFARPVAQCATCLPAHLLL